MDPLPGSPRGTGSRRGLRVKAKPSQSGRHCLAGGLLVMLTLHGCGTSSTRASAPPPPAVPGTGPPACFDARQVQSFRVLDRSSLVIYAPNRANAYYVRVNPSSPGLRDTERLAIVPPTGQICGYAGERIVAGPANLDRRFAILSVTRLPPEAERALREGGEGEEAPQPEAGPGAEVEADLD